MVADGEHGPSKRFHENGRLYVKGNHQHGEKHGLCEYFNKDGNLKMTETYKDGELVERKEWD